MEIKLVFLGIAEVDAKPIKLLAEGVAKEINQKVEKDLISIKTESLSASLPYFTSVNALQIARNSLVVVKEDPLPGGNISFYQIFTVGEKKLKLALVGQISVLVFLGKSLKFQEAEAKLIKNLILKMITLVLGVPRFTRAVRTFCPSYECALNDPPDLEKNFCRYCQSELVEVAK